MLLLVGASAQLPRGPVNTFKMTNPAVATVVQGKHDDLLLYIISSHTACVTRVLMSSINRDLVRVDADKVRAV